MATNYSQRGDRSVVGKCTACKKGDVLEEVLSPAVGRFPSELTFYCGSCGLKYRFPPPSAKKAKQRSVITKNTEEGGRMKRPASFGSPLIIEPPTLSGEAIGPIPIVLCRHGRIGGSCDGGFHPELYD
ncbi:MAG: hypothetical protein HYY92_01165 [Parcubacteria group bacterium]|nr:hypothetical protein [Parcubacteria group bacterium]